MKIQENEQRIFVDVDETLITTVMRPDGAIPNALDYYGTPRNFKRIHRHIELLKAMKQRGYYVIVHSANGWRWAKSVVEALKLEEYVDEVATKPLQYIDDKDAEKWMQRIFIEE